ncbi:embryonal Fyn-associated substrate [Polypterus senegalus]|uniref:embryonal Fyn-associated substrate n=1 Tax=Polypterus senegalus TaxID=55291 RepID=UPI0019651D02|nr:embryonal Fyn-associated substrate [Polypterus senegalus]
MSLSTVLAKALFDNAAESPDELAFRKGDILMVLEQDAGGVPGWWLCSLHGRQGIVPGNRLRLLQTQNNLMGAPDLLGQDCTNAVNHSSLYQSQATLQEAENNVYLAPSSGRTTLNSTSNSNPVGENLYLAPTSSKVIAGESLYQAPSSVKPKPGEHLYLVPSVRASQTVTQTSNGPELYYQAPAGVKSYSAAAHQLGNVEQANENVYLAPTNKKLVHPVSHVTSSGTYQAPVGLKVIHTSAPTESLNLSPKISKVPEFVYQVPTLPPADVAYPEVTDDKGPRVSTGVKASINDTPAPHSFLYSHREPKSESLYKAPTAICLSEMSCQLSTKVPNQDANLPAPTENLYVIPPSAKVPQISAPGSQVIKMVPSNGPDSQTVYQAPKVVSSPRKNCRVPQSRGSDVSSLATTDGKKSTPASIAVNGQDVSHVYQSPRGVHSPKPPQRAIQTSAQIKGHKPESTSRASTESCRPGRATLQSSKKENALQTEHRVLGVGRGSCSQGKAVAQAPRKEGSSQIRQHASSTMQGTVNPSQNPPIGQPLRMCQRVAPLSVRENPKPDNRCEKVNTQLVRPVEESLEEGSIYLTPLNHPVQKQEEEYVDPDDENVKNKVYDTPAAVLWGKGALPLPADESRDSIYNVPRTLNGSQQGVTQEHQPEVYDVPSLLLKDIKSKIIEDETYNVPTSTGMAAFPVGRHPTDNEEEDDVYSVPSLTGQCGILNPDGEELSDIYKVPGHSSKQELVYEAPVDVPETADECGVYDMPASLNSQVDETDAFLLEPESFIRRLSVSSTSSCQSKSSTESSLDNLASLISSAQSSASCIPIPKELPSLLNDIVASGRQIPFLVSDQRFSDSLNRIADMIPGLSKGQVPDSLVCLVCRALEEAASLLAGHTSTYRPRLSSQESLSRRPLPALPVAEVKPIKSRKKGLCRKGSSIQERPLPPPPPPSFPLPPPPTGDPQREEETVEIANEYEGIGLITVPSNQGADATNIPLGESGGYVKLQGQPLPEPPRPQREGPAQEQESTDPNHKDGCSAPLSSLSAEDRQLLSFYSDQSQTHLSALTAAIDALFASIQGNQPPRAFVTKGKLVIVTAHKLVFIGDTLSRLLSSSEVRSKVTTSGALLCQALKSVVLATKGAALHYPSVSALQDMVDRVAELSQHAVRFTGLLPRMANAL